MEEKTSAVSVKDRFGKHYQIIAFATKGENPRVFNRLRIDPPLPANHKQPRKNCMYVIDVWDDIRELTSDYFAGGEPLRFPNGQRIHKQQSPIQLLTRIIMSSSMPSDIVFDPFAATGTTLIVAKQLQRDSIGIEIDEQNAEFIRLQYPRKSDDIERFRDDYKFTQNLDAIWPTKKEMKMLI